VAAPTADSAELARLRAACSAHALRAAADAAETVHCVDARAVLDAQWAAARLDLAAAKRELEGVQRAAADADAAGAAAARRDEEALAAQQSRVAAAAADGVVREWLGSVAALQAEHNAESEEQRGSRRGLKMMLLEAEAGHEQHMQ